MGRLERGEGLAPRPKDALKVETSQVSALNLIRGKAVKRMRIAIGAWDIDQHPKHRTAALRCSILSAKSIDVDIIILILIQ